jgi:membrane associated rhomboid family serine protease
MSRYGRPSTISYSFGPGPMSPAVKWIVIANIALFVATFFFRPLIGVLGLVPQYVIERQFLWQPVTYMFLHADVFHILFNMLGIWMFGVELERGRWGTRFFVKYYAVTGVGAAATTVIFSLLPFGFSSAMYGSVTIGASGALYGVLLAYALYFPNRPILMFLLFPIPAKYFVMIIGGISFLSSLDAAGGGIAHAAHLGGLVVGYLYLKGGRGGFSAELKYRYLKWKMNRLRRKFDVHSGGRSDWDRHVH